MRSKSWSLLRCCLALGLVLASAWAALPAARAQSDALAEPRFDSIGDTRSINDGVVTALAQDSSGFIWVGTTTGVVRYDGYQLRAFPIGGRAAGADSGGTSFVRTLLTTPDGLLWVGLDGEGLARLDVARRQWRLFRPDPAQPGALANGTVRALAREADGTLWVGTTGGGLQRLAPGATQFTREHADPGAPGGALPDQRVQALWVDGQGDLWVGTWSGLVRRPRGTARLQPVLQAPASEGGLGGRIVSLLGQGPDGQLWVGTRQGDLVLIDPAGGQGRWVERAAAGDESLRSAIVSMAVLDEQEVWLGRDDGLDVRRAGSGELVRKLRRDLRRPWGLGGDNVVALLRDEAGGLWTGSYGGGLQRHTPTAGLWVRRAEGPDDGVLADGDVRSLAQLPGGEIWAGMNERGVAVFDPQLRLLAEIRPAAGAAPGRAGFAGGLVSAIAPAVDGTVWVGSDTGLYQFSAQRRLLGRYKAGQGRPRRLLGAVDGSVWVGTQDGVYRRAPGAAAAAGFQRLAQADGSALVGNVNALAEASDGAVWVGGNNGLFFVPAGQTRLQPVRSGTGQGLQQSVVLGLLLDREGTLWVDTNAGLHRLRRWEPATAQAQFQRVGGPGSPRGSFGANLLQDARGRIWTHQLLYDPRDDSHYELSAADGVDIGTGWFRSYLGLADGRLLFGGSTGLLVVEPERFRRWTYTPPLVVSDLRIDGQRVPLAELQPALQLGPQRRSVSVEFAALDYGYAERNRYRYRLLGAGQVDVPWISTGADFRVASFGNLSPGRYTLQVQGSNRVGDWSPRQLDLALQVQPAWWQTAWARALIALLLLAGVVAVVQLRTGLLRRRQVELERKVRERTLALEALSAQLQVQARALEESSLTDPLTGLHNRRFLARHIEADVAWAQRRHHEHLREPRRADVPLPEDADLVFFIVDIDHFKQINDRHGHAGGDAVLVQMRQRLQQAFRQADYLVRWGGEEFLIVARSTSRERAAALAARACAAVADADFVLDDGSRVRCTCSVGFAAYPLAPTWPEGLGWSQVVDLADAALYAAKDGGRNGWLGLVRAEADSEAALRAAAQGTLATWAASGGLRLAGSGRLAAALRDSPPAPTQDG